MRYVVYWDNPDLTVDSVILSNAKKRNDVIKDLLTSDDVDHICWCKVYASGEYGKRVWVS